MSGFDESGEGGGQYEPSSDHDSSCHLARRKNKSSRRQSVSEETFVDITIDDTDNIATEKLLKALDNLLSVAVVRSVDDPTPYDRAVSRCVSLAFERIKRQAITISDMATEMRKRDGR